MSPEFVIPFKQPKGRHTGQPAGQPPAPEIVETPPSPIRRAIGMTLVVLLGAALGWFGSGMIDIAASMPAIVASGEHSEAGDHLRIDLIAEQLNIARLNAALASNERDIADLVPPAEADPVLVGRQRQLLFNEVTEQHARIAALSRQQAQTEAELEAIAATVRKLETLIPLIEERVDIRTRLMGNETGSHLTYYEILQLLFEQQEELSEQKSRLREAEATVAAIRQARAQAFASFNRRLSDDLARSEQKASDLAQRLIGTQQATKLEQIASQGHDQNGGR